MTPEPLISDRSALTGAYLLPACIWGAGTGLRAAFGPEFLAGIALLAVFGWAGLHIGIRYWRLVRHVDPSKLELRRLTVTGCRPYQLNEHLPAAATLIAGYWFGAFDGLPRTLATTAMLLAAVRTAVAMGLLQPVPLPLPWPPWRPPGDTPRALRAVVGSEELCLITTRRRPSGMVAAWQITDGVFVQADTGAEAGLPDEKRSARRRPPL